MFVLTSQYQSEAITVLGVSEDLEQLQEFAAEVENDLNMVEGDSDEAVRPEFKKHDDMAGSPDARPTWVWYINDMTYTVDNVAVI